MALGNPYAKYQQNTVTTASPQELVLMLYNGAMKFIKQGEIYIDEKNMQNAHYSIVRAQDIVLHFMTTVDRNNEIGDNLYKLYDYMNRRLIDANIGKDTKILNEVYDLIKDLRDTWEEAMKIAKRGR